MRTPAPFLLAASIAAATLAGGDAGAVIRYDQFKPSDRCDAALPGFAQSLRARPLATVNEGSADVFITCGYGGRLWGTRTRSDILLRLYNFGGTDVETSCTLVDDHTQDTYLTKTRIISAGSTTAFDFFDDDNGGVLFNMVSVSCRLPPQVGIIEMGEVYEADPT